MRRWSAGSDVGWIKLRRSIPGMCACCAMPVRRFGLELNAYLLREFTADGKWPSARLL